MGKIWVKLIFTHLKMGTLMDNMGKRDSFIKERKKTFECSRRGGGVAEWGWDEKKVVFF